MPRAQQFSLFHKAVKHHKHRTRIWNGTTDEIPLTTIEARKYGKLHRVREINGFTNLQTETWNDDSLEQWLRRVHPPHLSSAGDIGELKGTIRLLICHERQVDLSSDDIQDGEKVRQPHQYISLKSFELVEELLALPTQTLPNLANRWGINSREFVDLVDGEFEETSSLDIVMKTAHIPELPHFGLALSYNFRTATTNAFLRGINAVKKDEDYDIVKHTLVEQFEDSLKHTIHLWRHPLLLPLVFLKNELDAIRGFSRRHLYVGSENIRQELNTESYEDMAELLGGFNNDDDARNNRAKFTNRINSILCTAISVRRSLQTSRRRAQFLLDTLGEFEQLSIEFAEAKAQKRMNQQVKDLVKSLDDGAAGFEIGIDAIISTLEAQLSVLATVASQLDNVRSAQIAAQAGLDSVAMKTLAVVTAVFLPATFIATLFSMSMFNWQADPNAGETTLSNKFWIFWVTSIPLTAVVLGLWWVWWNVSRYFYQDKFKDADSAAGTQMKALMEWLKNTKKGSNNSKHGRTPMAQSFTKEGTIPTSTSKGNASGSSNDDFGLARTASRSRTGNLEAGLALPSTGT